MSTKSIGDGVSIEILVQPRASRARFGPLHGDRIKVFVTSPPVEGEANDAVIDLLRRTFHVAKTMVTITSGHSSRRKTVSVAGISPSQVLEALQ